MKKAKTKSKGKVLRKVLGIAGLAYAGLFAVYYYDLDGKLIYYVVEPFLDKHYTAMERPDMTQTPYGAKDSVSLEVNDFGKSVQFGGAAAPARGAAPSGTGKFGEPKPKNVLVTM